MTRSRQRHLVICPLLGILLLGACSSFDGHPRPVISAVKMTSIADAYSPSQALEAFYGVQDSTQRRQYRDKVIGIYMAAIDAQYLDFRRSLSREAKGSRFGLDLGVLGLSSGASIAGERTANILSAGSAALTGARASMSREVFYEQALPSLLGNMDAARLRVRTNILVRMREDAASYSLPEAFADLSAYEASAALDKAIQKASSDAGDRVEEAEQRFDEEVLFVSGVPEPGVTELRRATKAKLAALVSDKAKIDAAGAAVGVEPGATPTDTIASIMLLFAAKADAESTEALAAKIQEALAAPAAADDDGSADDDDGGG